MGFKEMEVIKRRVAFGWMNLGFIDVVGSTAMRVIEGLVD
jgi:hypothetical protein